MPLKLWEDRIDNEGEFVLDIGGLIQYVDVENLD
jgi:hypothetical protein